MRMKQPILTGIFSLFCVARLWTPLGLMAEETVCPAVFPCNSDGTVQAPYNQGDCAPYFEEMCQPYAHCSMFCESEKEELVKQNRKLKKQLKSAKRRLMRGTR